MTQIFFSSVNDLFPLVNTLNYELESISMWLIVKLSLNISKSNYLLFADNKRINIDINIRLFRENILGVVCVKYLGVIIDHKISWKNHISHSHNKINRMVGILHKVKPLLPTESLVTQYYTLIYPYLHHFNAVWCMANVTTLKPLQILQKRIIRIIGKVAYDDHTAPLSKHLKILKISDIYTLESLNFIHDHLYIQQSISLQNIFQIHKINTRNRHHLR